MGVEHFKFEFKPEMAKELIPRKDWQEWYDAMCEILPLWSIDTVDRVAGFIAQCGHESAQRSHSRMIPPTPCASAAALHRPSHPCTQAWR